MGDGDEPVRVRLTVRGIVQGVGFRPFVHRLATQEGLVGSVVNTGAGVVIEAQGPAAAIGRFGKRLRAEAPPLAAIHDIASVLLPPAPGEGFVIDASRPQAGATTAVPPDVALCADCRREVRDPADRRFGYPFTNCTNCGPRWTIIESLPYDRPRTSMAAFTMCEACRAEYEDPADRRFHAQPNACPACGPRAWLCGEDGLGRLDDRPLAAAADALAKGLIVAVRGLGGFHLAVRADDHEAVARLRRRKHRAAKPLAVMVADVAAARALAEVTPGEEAVLTSPAAPIVLLAMHSGAAVAASVAPGHRRLGVMLPPTPLHLLLFDEVVARGIGALVMTSGNVADEPICIGNDDALEHLRGIADRWLLHDRPIARRADDSVLQVTAHGMLHVRRSRGYAPAPLPVAAPAGGAVLAVGGDLKNTVCLLKDGLAFLSPHVGELDDLDDARILHGDRRRPLWPARSNAGRHRVRRTPGLHRCAVGAPRSRAAGHLRLRRAAPPRAPGGRDGRAPPAGPLPGPDPGRHRLRQRRRHLGRRVAGRRLRAMRARGLTRADAAARRRRGDPRSLAHHGELPLAVRTPGRRSEACCRSTGDRLARAGAVAGRGSTRDAGARRELPGHQQLRPPFRRRGGDGRHRPRDRVRGAGGDGVHGTDGRGGRGGGGALSGCARVSCAGASPGPPRRASNYPPPWSCAARPT
jgi:acylphosphatase/tRNA A37 threonylcarbamoyladenosine synthetase subunit TsaC/SUA5/YrdC